MGTKVFILLHKRTYRRAVKLFLQTGEGKIEKRIVNFTTEHKISEKERNRNARQIPAEYTTTDERIYDALLRSRGYGKTFILKGDAELKLKREPFDVSILDSKKAALKNLFDHFALPYDGSKDISVLEAEYEIHTKTLTGRKFDAGSAVNIPHKEIDVHQSMVDQAEQARGVYKEKYGEDVPDGYTNDLAFLSALSDPDFDAKAYMEAQSSDSEDAGNTGNDDSGDNKDPDPNPETVEDVRKEYLEVIGANPANPKKNDIAWMKSKIAEKKASK